MSLLTWLVPGRDYVDNVTAPTLCQSRGLLPTMVTGNSWGNYRTINLMLASCVGYNVPVGLRLLV
jgi:hypothetical protein